MIDLSDERALELALSYDAEPEHVRAQVAEWLRSLGSSYAAGCAGMLMRTGRGSPRSRDPVWRGEPRMST